jgi:hypothetical protein
MRRPWLTGDGARRQLASDVVEEIQRRAAAGRDLNSGANRGDWLYAAALRFFGSWRAALEESGFAYEGVKLTALSAERVLHEICALASAGQELRANAHPKVAHAAQRHFGGWRAAVQVAGCELPKTLQWTADDVVTQIRADFHGGLSMRSSDVIERNSPLYGAARRRFGSWVRAIRVADPAIPMPRRGRPRATRQPAA